uniref:Uncharacterized protein n=1 Tax=Karlodinium veneficum TaxID=407301 RepID=E8Z704_KARVE|nr:unknown [Karlodinium veneficum]
MTPFLAKCSEAWCRLCQKRPHGFHLMHEDVHVPRLRDSFRLSLVHCLSDHHSNFENVFVQSDLCIP